MNIKAIAVKRTLSPRVLDRQSAIAGFVSIPFRAFHLFFIGLDARRVLTFLLRRLCYNRPSLG